ncbi:MAG: hypothetical protein IJS26_05290 [Alphaproteobacteria bacterium]|nr:hypothetical protein [Alphaproteobacteria bacterium]
MFEKIYQVISSGFTKPLQRKKAENFSTYVFGLRDVKKTTPTYQTIACDLLSKKDQVFEAAAYTLCVIALHKKAYRQDILALLEKSFKANAGNQVRQAFLKNIISYHGLDEAIHNQ